MCKHALRHITHTHTNTHVPSSHVAHTHTHTHISPDITQHPHSNTDMHSQVYRHIVRYSQIFPVSIYTDIYSHTGTNTHTAPTFRHAGTPIIRGQTVFLFTHTGAHSQVYTCPHAYTHCIDGFTIPLFIDIQTQAFTETPSGPHILPRSTHPHRPHTFTDIHTCPPPPDIHTS